MEGKIIITSKGENLTMEINGSWCINDILSVKKQLDNVIDEIARDQDKELPKEKIQALQNKIKGLIKELREEMENVTKE